MTSTTTTPTAAAPRTLAWFSIPVIDLDRATRFYESMLDTTLRREISGGVPMAIFSAANGASSSDGGLVQDPHGSRPAAAGALIYLSAGTSVTAALERARRAGGAVDGPVIELPREIGYVGFVHDTEGNRVGLHAPGR
ncbi:VOC family protein [Burkholderia plantarii]|uniref:VOC family protein n=1 Tax=Burkholderia plantarii TaxID=41899 RepID=UPI00272D4260|nr:VOC family protein [Burkholderia plantarii]WLE58100.1 VOC family protein [Burkholderia plantarii]